MAPLLHQLLHNTQLHSACVAGDETPMCCRPGDSKAMTASSSVAVGCKANSLVQAPAPPRWCPVKEVKQKMRHKHTKAHWVNHTQRVHALAVVARQHARDECPWWQQQTTAEHTVRSSIPSCTQCARAILAWRGWSQRVRRVCAPETAHPACKRTAAAMDRSLQSGD